MLVSALQVSKTALLFACKSHLKEQAWKSISQYERQLWSACLSFFRGESNAFEFIDDFMAAVDNQLTRAWNEGARNAGVDPKEFEGGDTLELERIIQSEEEHILNLAGDIEDAILQDIGIEKFRSQFKSRIDLWVNRYNETVNAAVLWFGGRQKLKWVMGATEEHCETCSRLNGIVAYATEWEQSGIKPQNPPNDILECGGWRCDCSLEPTDDRKTANALETLLEIATARNV